MPAETDYSIYWEWGLYALGLIFLIYAAITIKNEKDAYHESAKEVLFHDLSLLIPSWWEKTIQETHLLEFRRQGYDWYARFEWRDLNPSDLESFFFQEMEKRKIVIDQDERKVQEKNFSTHFEKSFRVESTATEDLENRLYLDWAVLKLEKGILLCESRSAVLHGVVEGPYFEEVLLRVRPYEAGNLEASERGNQQSPHQSQKHHQPDRKT